MENKPSEEVFKPGHILYREDTKIGSIQPAEMAGKTGVNNMTNIDQLYFTATILKATWHTVHIWQIPDCF